MNAYSLTLCIVAIVCICFTLRLWIRAHYGAKNRSWQEEGEGSFAELQVVARRLEERIHSLEAILDKDIPDWRKKL